MRKHPVSIALSKQTLANIDKAANADNRKRSDWVEKHFKQFFEKLAAEQEAVTEIAINTG